MVQKVKGLEIFNLGQMRINQTDIYRQERFLSIGRELK
jgi:hypothetical protein